MARPVRRVGLAQVPAREPRPEPAPDGARLRRHLLLAPLRPGDAARGDDGRARHGRAPGQGALRRHLLVLGGEDARGGGDPARPRHAAPHPPALVLDAEPLDRGRSCSTCSGTRASAASPSRRSRRACSPTSTCNGIPEGSRASQRQLACSPTCSTDETLAKIRALNEIAAAPRPVARADGARLGAARPARDLGADRRVAASRSSRTNVAALDRLDFTDEELAEIDRHATDSGINIWASSSAE